MSALVDDVMKSFFADEFVYNLIISDTQPVRNDDTITPLPSWSREEWTTFLVQFADKSVNYGQFRDHISNFRNQFYGITNTFKNISENRNPSVVVGDTSITIGQKYNEYESPSQNLF